MPLLIPFAIQSSSTPPQPSPGWQSIVQIFRPGGVHGNNSTLLAAISSTGFHSANVSNGLGLVAGDQLVIGRGTANQETVTISSVNALAGVFSATFTKTHALGDPVDGSVSGSPLFLRDLTKKSTKIAWTDYQQTGLGECSLECELNFEDYLDVVAGNWLVVGLLGGVTVGTTSSGATSMILTGYTDDLGNPYIQVSDVLMISDGVNTDLVTVDTISYSGNQATVGFIAAPGNPGTALLNTYSAGATVARLQYQGKIAYRIRSTRLDKQFTVYALGFADRYNEALANVSIVRWDTGKSIYGLLSSYASTIPEIIVNSTNFVDAITGTGILATSQGNDTTVMQGLTDLLRQENANALVPPVKYVVYVDATRRVFHSVLQTTTPTLYADLVTGGSGIAAADKLGPLDTTDMDLTALVNCVKIYGGTQTDGTQLQIIVRDLTSINQFGYYEGVLNNPNLTDTTSAAAWGAAQLAILAYPLNNSKIVLTTSSMRITARDLLQITGFTDASTQTVNPVQVQYAVDSVNRIATASIDLSVLNSTAESVMAEIASEYAVRATNQVPPNNIKGNYVISGFDISVAGTIATIAAGVIFYNGTKYSIASQSFDLSLSTYAATNGGTFYFGADSALGIVQAPTALTLSGMTAPVVYSVLAGVITEVSSIAGPLLWRVTAVAGGTIIGTGDLRLWGGVSNNNAPPPGTTLSGTTLGSIVLAAEGLASVSAKVPVTLPAAFVNATWLREISIASSIAGAGLWAIRNTISAPSSASQTFQIHGLAAGQSYDLALVAVALDGEMTAWQLLGTSPTISAASITAALLNYNEFSPTGVLQSDGSVADFDGVVGQTVFHNIPTGALLKLFGTITAGSTATNSDLFLSSDGTEANGYGLRFTTANKVELYKTVASTVTVLATLSSSLTYDTKPHSFQLSCVVGSTNKVDAAFDALKDTIVADSAITIGTAYWINRGGGSAGTIRNYGFTIGPASAPTSGGLRNQGSIPPIGNMPQFSYTSTTTSITLTASAQTVYLSDGTSIALSSYNNTFTGLVASTAYYFDIAWDIPSSSWVVNISAANTHQTEQQQILDCYADGRIADAADFGITTPASGGGGGTGGGSCPAAFQLVETQERGVVRADSLRIGEHLRDPESGWNKITACGLAEDDIWALAAARETVFVNAGHMVLDENDTWVPVTDLRPGHRIKRHPAGVMAVTDAFCIGPGQYVPITCERNRYVLGNHYGHNVTNPGQCPAVGQEIETLERGFVPAESLCIGERLRDPYDGWNMVLGVGRESCVVYRITTEDESVLVNDTHGVLCSDGMWRDVKTLKKLLEIVPFKIQRHGGGNSTLVSVEVIGPGEYVPIKCERERYVLGNTFSHNITL